MAYLTYRVEITVMSRKPLSRLLGHEAEGQAG